MYEYFTILLFLLYLYQINAFKGKKYITDPKILNSGVFSVNINKERI